MTLCAVVVIHIPPSKKYISNTQPSAHHAIHVLYMVVESTTWVSVVYPLIYGSRFDYMATCLRYWILSTCVGTKKPHVAGVWLGVC